MDNGIVAGLADIPALERVFGPMTTQDQWLEGSGKALFKAALDAPQADVALR